MSRLVLSLSSQVVFGPVGNTAIVPALQAAGCTVMQLPTILLSAHPGHGTPVVQPIADDTFTMMLETLEHSKKFDDLAAIITGYFGSPAQVSATANLIARCKARNPHLFILIDPVLGDEQGLYVKTEIAAAMRDQLLPLATCITPNRFELAWLTDQSITRQTDVAASQLAISEILATSIPDGANTLLTVLRAGGALTMVSSSRKANVPHGTGDFLAGLYLACRLLNLPPPQALKQAMVALERSIAESIGQPSLALEPGLCAMRQLLSEHQ